MRIVRSRVIGCMQVVGIALRMDFPSNVGHVRHVNVDVTGGDGVRVVRAGVRRIRCRMRIVRSNIGGRRQIGGCARDQCGMIDRGFRKCHGGVAGRNCGGAGVYRGVIGPDVILRRFCCVTVVKLNR